MGDEKPTNLFADPAMRERFRRESYKLLVRNSRMVVLLSGLVLLLMATVDSLVLPHVQGWAFLARLCVIGTALLTWIAMELGIGRRVATGLILFTFGLAAVLTATLSILAGGFVNHYSVGLIVVVFLPALFLPLHPRLAAVNAVGAIGVYVAANAAVGHATQTSIHPSALVPIFGLSAAAILSTTASALAWYARRNSFALRVRLEQANDELARRIDDQRERIELEQSLRVREGRLATIGRLSSLIAQDLRNPLASVLSYGEMVRAAARRSDREEGEACLSELQNEARRLGRMVAEILDVSREDAPHVRKTPCLAAEFLREVVGPLRDRVGIHGVRVDLEARLPGAVMVSLDWDRMHRVIENLVENAHRSLVHSDRNVSNRWIRISAAAGSHEVVIRVADNGAGVPRDLRRDLFEPFCASAKSGGAGLGLANARRIVEAHGGAISLEDGPPEGGATFAIRLPRLRLERTDPPHRVGEGARDRHAPRADPVSETREADRGSNPARPGQ